MAEETTVVETKIEDATTQPAEVTVNASEVDYEAVLKQKDDELAQVRKEKENYRKGMLKAKGKLPEESLDNDTPEELEALIDRKVTEKLLSTKEAQLQADKDALIAKTLKRNKELEVALKNRGQISITSAGGSNEDKPEVKTDKYFSAEQIAYFKKQGKSDEWINTARKNMTRGSEMPK